MKKRNYKKRAPVKRKTIVKVAKQTMMNAIPTKKHLIDQTLHNGWGAIEDADEHALDPESNINWVIFRPLDLDLVGKDDNVNTRTEANVFAKNYLLNGELMINQAVKGCVQVRTIMGYFKGTSSVATTSFNNNVLKASGLDSFQARFDPQTAEGKSYKIISDTKRTYHPLQIYDLTSGDRSAEDSGLTNDNVGLWRPIKINRNFKFNRRYEYENEQGNSLVGWLPFIAIGVFPCHDANIGPQNQSMFDRTPGHLTAPTFDYESRMYFKDINN